MIQRSIEADDAPVVVVRCGADCVIEGYDGNRVLAETDSQWGGINVRIVARAGNRTLFHGEWSSGRPKITLNDDAIEVNVGGSCRVKVPASSSLKVYAGKHASVAGVDGPVGVNAGGDVRVSGVALLEPCNAGGEIDADCERLATDDAKFQAGRDIRLRVRDLADTYVRVNDLGGYWEGFVGDGSATLWLKCGGVATLVTDQAVRGEVLGNIERPGAVH